MDKIKVLVLGLGNFGHSWADSVVPACDDCASLAAVVDKDERKWKGIEESVPKYHDLATAIEEIRPELVINVTPPALHFEINEMLLRKQIAVLCEKPIADTYENAVKTGKILGETGGFLMIGENYRYHPVFREAKKILQSGVLGGMHHIQCHFRHEHGDYSMFYHGTLRHPLLSDVTIHHLDLARYLSGEEPVKVWCKEYSAPYSWYDYRLANADIISEMTDDVVFHYDGTLASPLSTTDWNGDWEIECDKGILQIKNNQIILHKENGVEEIPAHVNARDSREAMLREACAALRENRKAETDFADNFKSFRWMTSAIESSETGEWIIINGGQNENS